MGFCHSIKKTFCIAAEGFFMPPGGDQRMKENR
jgi:hypothetical protein